MNHNNLEGCPFANRNSNVKPPTEISGDFCPLHAKERVKHVSLAKLRKVKIPEADPISAERSVYLDRR